MSNLKLLKVLIDVIKQHLTPRFAFLRLLYERVIHARKNEFANTRSFGGLDHRHAHCVFMGY
jgi:hypothetical protein